MSFLKADWREEEVPNNMTEKDKSAIKDLISEGDINQAINTLLSIEMPQKDRSIVVQIKAANEQLRNNSIRGVLSFEQQTTEQNRINDRLLKFLDGDETAVGASGDTAPKKNWGKYAATFTALVAVLAGIAELSGYSLRDILSGSDSTDNVFTVTVFVHGKKGKDDRLLKNQGQVMLGLRTNEMPCSINDKGEATFKEISMGFKGQKVPIRIEHPQPYRPTHPDSLYLLEPNAAIFVEVALEGTHVIKGKVMDFYTEQWLDSVRVSVENVATYTDQFGWFELEIPEDKQRKFQRVSFFKKGYEIDELDSVPVHTQQEIHISLRKSTKR